MIGNDPFPLKHVSLWFLLIFCGLITTYIIFIALISVWIGLRHIHMDGFWMPILAGTFSLIAIFWLFLRFSRFILTRMKEKDLINI